MPELDLSAHAPSLHTKCEENNVSARRLKKREIDRRCQRQARERTKSRIAYLEELVDNLKRSDSDGRTATLMRRLAETERERDALGHTLKEIQKVLIAREPQIKVEEDSSVYAAASPSPASPVDELTKPRRGSGSADDAYEPLADIPICKDATLPPTVDPDVVDLPKVCNDACECCKVAAETPTGPLKSRWRYANDKLLEPYTEHNPITPEEDLLAEDMPIRIVLEGWDAVEQQFGLPTSWKILRGIDQNLFATCAPTERLAVLRTMHLLLQYHRDPTPERRASLPPWFLARPSQSIPHAYAINYFVWPGLRERFIFQQHKYCSNLFWQLFSGCLEMSWPYDFRDCFAQRRDTGIYQLTPVFQECISDISRWTMRNDLFAHFPDLRCDIPASICSPRPVSNLVQLQVGSVTRSRNDTHTKQNQLLEDWSIPTPWLESNHMFMAMQPENATMATPWIS